MIYSRITAVGDYLPKKILTNADLERMVETTDAWITERTGIKARHIAGEQETTASMALAAAQKALTIAGITPADIELIIVATCTPDYLFPSTACLVQAGLGAPRQVMAFDVSAACAGFIYALATADQFIRSGKIKRALVIGAETLSRCIDWTDRGVCVLFGDGAGACLLEASAQPGIIASQMQSDGSCRDMLYLPNKLPVANPDHQHKSPFVSMNGADVYKLAVTELGNIAEKILQDNNVAKANVDWLVPHQANLRIIHSVAKRLELPMERVILTIAGHGNTSAASIPLALAAGIADGRIKQGQTILLDAIGGGMTWGATLLKW